MSGVRSWLARIGDHTLQQALRALADATEALDARLATLDANVLKRGSPVDAHSQRIRNVEDPKYDTDVVNLRTLRQYVEGALTVAEGLPDRPTVDAGAPPTIPLPTGTFTASPTSLGAGGGNVTFTWTTQNADTVESSLHGPIPLNGNLTSLITASFTITLTLRGPGGITTYDLTVTVASTPPPTPKPTGTFQAIPATLVAGQSATLTWTSANATSAQISPGVGVVAPSVGTLAVTPAQTTTYELRLDGAGGTTILQATITVTTTPPPPPPPPSGSYTAGLLTWGFSNGTARFPWKGYTAFSMFHDALDLQRAGQSALVASYFGAHGCTVPRVFLTMAGTPFEPSGFRLYPPERSNFFSTLAQFVPWLNAQGQMPEIVLFGAFVEIWGTDFEAMKAFVRQVATTLLPYRGCFIQIANEWNQIGFTNAGQLIELANEYKKIDPTRPLTLSAPNGPGDTDTSMIAAPADYLTAHMDRVVTPQRYQWILRHYGHPTMANGVRPAVSDEPINAGYALGRTDNEPDPQYWWAFGVTGQLLGWSGTFHYDGGLFNAIPSPGSAEEGCLLAWLRGLNYPSPDQGGTLFAATPGGVAFGPSPWPNSGANTAVVGRVTSAGTAYALTFGASPLPAVSAGWGTPLVDATTSGVFPLPGQTGPYSNIRGYTVPQAGL